MNHNSSLNWTPPDRYLHFVNGWRMPNTKYWCNKTTIDKFQSNFHDNTMELIALGLLTLCTNMCILALAFGDPKLRAKSAFMIGLAGGNAFNGLVLCDYVLGRLIRQYLHLECETVSIFLCTVQLLPVLTLFAWQVPAFVLCAAGLDRMMAVCKSDWHRRQWKNAYSWRVVFAAFIYVLIIQVPILIIYTWIHRDLRALYTCDWMFLVDIRYSFYINCTVVICGSASCLCTVISLAVGSKYLNRFDQSDASSAEMRKRICKHLQMTKCMFVVCILDFCLVVVPNIVLLAIDVGRYDLLFSAAWPAIYSYSANSLPHPFIYAYFNKRFRQVIRKKMSSLRKAPQRNNVVPIAINVKPWNTERY